MNYSNLFNFCFSKVVDIEKGFTKDPNDDGNWTGGRVNVGELKGTKWGISAASYPNLDIENLTEDAAKDIYYRDFWTPMQGDKLPSSLALILFDSAVNQGVGTAIKFVQSAINVKADGNLGNVTLTATTNEELNHKFKGMIGDFLQNYDF